MKSEWRKGNQKYMNGNWIVAPTPEGWVIGCRPFKEVRTFQEVKGLRFDSSEEARRKADELRTRRGW